MQVDAPSTIPAAATSAVSRPLIRMIARSLRRAARSTFCSASTTGVPRSATPRTISKISSCACGDRPSDGSSSSSIFGLASSTIAISRICCSPPLRLPASWRRFAAASGICSSSRRPARCRSRADRRRRRARGSRARSSAGNCNAPAARAADRGATSTAAAARSARRSRATVPPITRSMPTTAFSSVDLPAPFGPIRSVTPRAELDRDAADDRRAAGVAGDEVIERRALTAALPGTRRAGAGSARSRRRCPRSACGPARARSRGGRGW